MIYNYNIFLFPPSVSSGLLHCNKCQKANVLFASCFFASCINMFLSFHPLTLLSASVFISSLPSIRFSLIFSCIIFPSSLRASFIEYSHSSFIVDPHSSCINVFFIFSSPYSLYTLICKFQYLILPSLLPHSHLVSDAHFFPLRFLHFPLYILIIP